MAIIDTIKTSGILGINVSCILLIMCLYILWVGLYQYDSEFMLGLLLIILGILYISVIYMIMTKHSILGSSLLLLTIVLIISIAVTSGFKQSDGSQGSTFLFLGIAPMLSGICFAFLGAGLMTLLIF